MRLRRRPEPPVGVRIVRRDGTELDVEIIYTGRHGGVHRWRVAGVILRQGDAITIERLPARTAVEGAYEP